MQVPVQMHLPVSFTFCYSYNFLFLLLLKLQYAKFLQHFLKWKATACFVLKPLNMQPGFVFDHIDGLISGLMIGGG